MQRRQLAQTIADALFQAEDSADISLRDASNLINTLTSARLDNRLSAVLGADALCAATEAVRAFGEARGRLVTAHHALAAAAPWLVGQHVELAGPMTGKPETDETPIIGRLRRVA